MLNKVILVTGCLFIFLSGLVSQSVIPLNGKWSFSLDENDKGIDEKWYNIDLTDEFNLPGSNVENLKGNDISLTTPFTGSIYDSSWYFNPHLEKYRQPGNIKVPFWLTQNKYYLGPAWYQKEVMIPASWKGKQILLTLERAHFVSSIYVGDQWVGTQNSLTTPHVFNLTKFLKAGSTNKLSIRIDNRLKNMDVGANSHSVTDHTQGNWNGVVGKLQLETKSPVWISNIQVFPDIKNKTARLKFKLQNLSGKKLKGNIVVNVSGFNSKIAHTPDPVSIPFESAPGETLVEKDFVMGDQVLLWDEFDPNLYLLKAEIVQGKKSLDQAQTQFGMREISIEGKYIYINGNKTMLRGTVENALFPLTGYPPMDVASWERVFNICKAYGLNHMRFHSYCPPEACFIAADKTGFYLQPEGPSWPNHSTQLGRGYPIDQYLMDETNRMVDVYGNYASFVMMAAGNEPRGPWVPWVSKFVHYWEKKDNRRIYTGASVGGSWAWQPDNQFHVKAGARGLNWSRERPESLSDYAEKIDTVKQPYISHETGQWCVFPDFSEIPKYTGVTRAKNFEMFKEEFYSNDLGGLETKFLNASGKLQALCYKHEIEKTLRTPDYAGFQLLSLNDFSGQGTALVGVTNAFFEDKGYVNAQEFSQFCTSTVPVLRMNKFVFYNTDTIKADVQIAHFGKEDLINTPIIFKVSDSKGNVLKNEEVFVGNVVVGNEKIYAKISYPLNQFVHPDKINLEISLKGKSFKNNWNCWVYPEVKENNVNDDIYICETWDDKATKIAAKGGKILVLAAGKIEYGKDVVQYYQPAFWNTSWFKMRPPHTTGLYIRSEHPVFKDFVTDDWADLQWWELTNRTQTMLLTDFPQGFQPIVQPIDTWFINRKLGMLLEAKVGNAKVMVTSMDLQNKWNERPVAATLYNSVIKYIASDEFQPAMVVPEQNIKDLFVKQAPKINMFTKGGPDDLKQGPQPVVK